MELINKVKKTIEEHKLIIPGDLVITGVSGGPDSLALLHILNRLKDEMNFKIHVAHLDHSFRGKEAEDEAIWVFETAQQWGLQCTTEKTDVPFLVETTGASPQDAGHRARKAFFLRLYKELHAQRIALGHQADDQAETLIMHFLTGAGPEGLTGIRPSNYPFIRPLLFVFRKDIEEYCSTHGLKPLKDPSNQKNVYLRNKIRNVILPLLKAEVNPNLAETLNKTAQVFCAEEEYWETATQEIAKRCCEEEEGAAKLDLNQFSLLHLAQQRRIIRYLYHTIKKGQGLAFPHVEDVRKLALQGQTGKILHLPEGVKVMKTYGFLKFTLLEYNKATDFLEARRLNIPGITAIPEKGLVFKAELITEIKEPLNMELTAAIPFRDEPPELWVRPRRPGDIFSPKGLNGSKKLKNYFIDKKVPREERDQTLLLARDGEVLWIPGMAVSSKINVIETGKSYVLLKIIPSSNL